MNNGFIHSVKVPQLYKTAAKIIQRVAEGGGSIKQLVFEKKHINVNALYALVMLPIQKAGDIAFLFKRTQLLEKEPRFDPWLAKVLISELLWGKKCLPKNECKPIQTILSYEQAFKAHLSDTPTNNEEFSVNVTKKKPRYVRINTLLITFQEALEYFQNEGWILTNPEPDYKKFLNQVENLSGDYFLKDIHVPNLLIFPPGTKFFSHEGYTNGWILLQDKASCLPVHILNPTPGSVVLDMCAAPGMKTTQLAAALNNQGTVYAVERDERRYKTLEKMVETSGATCVKTLNKDILACNSEEFPNAKYILVDPSCSGSGMTDRLEFHEEQSKARLEKLAGFQIKILRNALTRYPNVERVVYSTCSTYPEENEDVVRQVLETNHLFRLVDAKTLIDENWLNFGSPDFGNIGQCCLYAKPDQDFTNGFFVAVFERVKEGERNEFFNSKLFNYKKHIEQQRIKREHKNETRKCSANNNKNIGMDQKGNESEYNEHNESLDKNKNTVDDNKHGCLPIEEKETLVENKDQDLTEQLEVNQTKSEDIVKKEKKKKQLNESYQGSYVDIDNEGFVIKTVKKKKKRVSDTHEGSYLPVNDVESTNKTDKPKKTVKDDTEESKVISEVLLEKKEKKKKRKVVNESTLEDFELVCSVEKKEKKKKRKLMNDSPIEDCENPEAELVCSVEKKEKNKKRKIDNDSNIEDCESRESKLVCSVEKKEKRKKRKLVNDSTIEDCENPESELVCSEEKKKKKKKRKLVNDSAMEHCENLESELACSVEKTKKKKKCESSDDEIEWIFKSKEEKNIDSIWNKRKDQCETTTNDVEAYKSAKPRYYGIIDITKE